MNRTPQGDLEDFSFPEEFSAQQAENSSPGETLRDQVGRPYPTTQCCADIAAKQWRQRRLRRWRAWSGGAPRARFLGCLLGPPAEDLRERPAEYGQVVRLAARHERVRPGWA